VFLYLAIKHGFEPLLLVPIAFGMLLVNIYPDIMAEPYEMLWVIEHAGGLLHYFFILDEWSILPSLIFMGVGAMTDFGPLIANPISFFLGAAAQLGIYRVLPGYFPGIQRKSSSSNLYHWWCRWPDFYLPGW
jgi:oxaloacetate decarboxylase beta subunit